MFKVLIPLLVASIMSLGVGGVAYTASHALPEAAVPTLSEAAHRNPAAQGLAQITAVGDDQLTVVTLKGKSLNIQVNESTRYHDLQGNSLTFADLQVGRWLTASLRRDDGALVARRIVLFPPSFDPQQIARRVGGEVTAVSSSSFTLHTARGEDLTITVDANTLYAGIADLSELQSGMKASAALKESANGSLTAVLVGARFPLIHHAGQVTAVQTAQQTFSIETRQGERLTFTVDENTRFVGKEGAPQSLADLTTEMNAIVGARQLEDGSYLAVNVAARVRPAFDLKVVGKITALDTSALTIQTRDGQTYTFQISADTRFHSRGGKVNGLDDLRLGMHVGVGAQDLGDGQYQALVILAARR